jgi:hypothetical protein
MAKEQKKTQEGFHGCSGGMPCGDMMQKMMEAKKSGQPFNCAELMAQMMKIWGGSREKKVETKENPIHNPQFPCIEFPNRILH